MYARPGSLADALRLLRGATALAGGTDLLGLMKGGVVAPERIVDLTGVEGMQGWSRERGVGVRIGALASLVELEMSEELARLLPILRQSLTVAATPQLRAAGTVGGNLLQRNRCWYFRDEAFPCWLKGGERCFAVAGDSRYHAVVGAEECHIVAPSDLAPVLIAYDATVELRGPRGTRRMPLADLYVRPSARDRREHSIRAGEILTRVTVPERALQRTGAFLKAMDRKAWSFALVAVAASARVRDGRLRDPRIVLGGVAAVPWRVQAAERALDGRAPDDRACAEAADVLFADALPLKDNAYKVTLGKELIRRALRALVA